MEEKKSNGLLVVIAVLFLIIGGVGGYFISTSFLNEKKLVKNPNNEEIEVDYDLTKAEELVSKYHYFSLHDVEPTNLSDYNIIFPIVMQNIDISKFKKESCDKLYKNSDKAKYDNDAYIVYRSNNTTEEVGYCEDSAYIIPYNDVNSVYKDLFGQNKNLPKINILSEVSASYEETIDSYVWGLACRCGGTSVDEFFYKVKSAKVKGNKLVVTSAYATLDGNSMEYYDITIDGVGYLKFTNDEVDKSTFESEFMNKYIDKLKTYEYTFEKENNHYVLVNFKG